MNMKSIFKELNDLTAKVGKVHENHNSDDLQKTYVSLLNALESMGDEVYGIDCKTDQYLELKKNIVTMKKNIASGNCQATTQLHNSIDIFLQSI